MGFEDHPNKIMMQALREYSEKDKGFFMRLAELQSQMEVMLPKIEDNDPT